MLCNGDRSLPRRSGGWVGWLLAVALLAFTGGCGTDTPGDAPPGAGDESGEPAGTVSLYTSYSQEVIDALLAAYGAEHPDVSVELFRAPTGQLSARIATEQRSGGIRGDVLLLSDPLSMQQYAADGLLRSWSPEEASAVPADAKSDTFWGVSTIDVVAVHRPGAAPTNWVDLTDPRYRDAIALPDPGFAGSAFGALGFFAFADGFGFDYYRALKENGAVQVQAPDEVIAGVAEGRFEIGMALDFSARQAIENGSPIEVTAPEPGAIRLYGPVAVFADTADPAAAESFANFLLTRPAQEVIADFDRRPIRSDVEAEAPDVPAVAPDWPAVFEQQDDLRATYRDIFGG